MNLAKLFFSVVGDAVTIDEVIEPINQAESEQIAQASSSAERDYWLEGVRAKNQRSYLEWLAGESNDS